MTVKLEDRFRGLRQLGEGAFIPFITLGDPDPDFTPKLADTILKNGGDILELGIPFSDPIADGPTIQAATDRALKRDMNTEMAFHLAEEIRRITDNPLVFLSYYNIVLRYGLNGFFKDMEDVDVEGLIIPDLPVEEAGPALKAAKAHGRDLIFLVAPTTTEIRLRKILSKASGFIYLVSLLGVTGARGVLRDITKRALRRVRSPLRGRAPVAVGFGISKPEHVREIIGAGADGAIVGSAIIDLLAANLDDEKKALREIGEYVSRMKSATVMGDR
ncbi:MAG: tryptophan synthase subunit alpha [Candidatus Geothermarchaeales archaeon]